MEQERAQRFSLAWNPNPPITVGQIVLYAILTGVATVLAWLGTIAFPIGFAGVSALYIGVAFFIPFALWFGGWGVLLSYIGAFLGGGVIGGGQPILLAMFASLAHVWQCGIPLLAYRTLGKRMGVDPTGRVHGKSFGKEGVFFLIFVVVLPNLIGGFWGIGGLTLGGIIPPEAYVPASIGWWVSNMIACIIISPILLNTVTQVLERMGLLVQGLWS